MTIHKALTGIGLDRKKVYAPKQPKGRKIHVMPEGRLYDILEEARAVFRKHIRKAHPDLGGDHEACSRLVKYWRYVQAWMKRRGVQL